jgi:hypothetical protein
MTKYVHDLTTITMRLTMTALMPKAGAAPDDSNTLLSTQAAAERLTTAFPAPEGHWYHYLNNNRRHDRSPAYRIPTVKWGGAVLYHPDELDSFIDHERRRRALPSKGDQSERVAAVIAAFGLEEGEPRTTGRRLQYTVCPGIDDETGELFVQLTIQKPLLVFRLEPDEAADFVAEFMATLRVLKRARGDMS